MGLDQLKVELCSHWGGDRNAANAAWASSTNLETALSRTDDDVRRVVTGLAQLHHDTPKERVWMEFFLVVPIMVERQLDKYRMSIQVQDAQITWQEGGFGRWGITQNELSGRYRTIPDRPYTLPADVATIMHKAAGRDLFSGFASEGVKEFDKIVAAQHEWYQGELRGLKASIEAGLISNAEYKRAREVLRGILGTAYLTDMRLVLNLNALEHIINQRLAKDAQLESRYVASKMLDAVVSAEVAPTLINEMIWENGWAELLEDL